MFKVTYPHGQVEVVPAGTTLLALAKKLQKNYKTTIVEGVINGVGRDLQREITEDCTVDFIEVNSSEGNRVYVRSLLATFLLAMHVKRPEVHVEVRNSLGNGIFCVVKNNIVLSKYDLADVTQYMLQLIASKEPIVYQRLGKEKVMAGLDKYPNFFTDSAPLVKALPDSMDIIMYSLKGVQAYFFGPMLPHLGYLQAFELVNYENGMLLRYPDKSDYTKLQPFVPQPKLSKVYDLSEALGQRIGCPTVAALNKFILDGKNREIIQVCEAQHEKKISQIADQIAENGSNVKLILIAGPSSSGKTTFAQRLSVQMRVNGLNPMPLSLDNYFKERKDTPRLPTGEYDFECLEALDLDLFHKHLTAMLAGETVKIPHYNFRTGTREFRGQEINLGENGVLVVEGIHGLNEKLSSVVPAASKMKIYISALTPLSFDDFNRISTSDMRLLRRMVRDSQFRAHDALKTLRSWSNVREGEKKYIFPFAEEADVMFNTTLIYEFAVFKKYAEPLLKAIPKEAPEHVNAYRLLGQLYHVRSIDDAAIPSNSIIREFIGNSIYGDVL